MRSLTFIKQTKYKYIRHAFILKGKEGKAKRMIAREKTSHQLEIFMLWHLNVDAKILSFQQGTDPDTKMKTSEAN